LHTKNNRVSNSKRIKIIMNFPFVATSALFLVASVTGNNLRTSSYNGMNVEKIQKLQNKIDLLEKVVASKEELNSAEGAEEKIDELESKINLMKSIIESKIQDEEKQLEGLIAVEERQKRIHKLESNLNLMKAEIESGMKKDEYEETDRACSDDNQCPDGLTCLAPSCVVDCSDSNDKQCPEGLTCYYGYCFQ